MRLSLVKARQQEIIVICGSGKRSVMAANTMQDHGLQQKLSH